MNKISQIIILISFSIFIIACQNNNTNRGQQYNQKFTKNITKIEKIHITNKITNSELFLKQIQEIEKSSPSLYLKNKPLYNRIINWLKENSKIKEIDKFGINIFQMKGIDNYGNVKITAYYTPVINARKIKQNQFKYPIYSMPQNTKKNQLLPKRKDIYDGILDKKYILAYSDSLINNFIMEIQGSAFISYGDNKPLTFFSYAGKNGRPYKAIGQILINRGEISKKNMSMQAIKEWCKTHTKQEVKSLFEENTSFVFFKETKQNQVYGANGVPLIPQTSIAVDNSIVKKGSVILLKIPLLNKQGIFINEYEMHLVVALDVGGAIKGQHFDLYEGIGEKAGILAGFYNHYGYAWILK
ncbi:murein transglycosylase [Buchnera aphidicola (Diuraphis noxia)]|uniref:peptidoglycan lytic exotransglycosylase n=1 Tax=Buchnera aphidicola subsp. Diuraphis noxia TaxID=118101 RepID=A0A1B2H952_BUCDN|nr:murein transglycosylase A [Buchnera aphidicola]ANZ22648.1 murein transglycosylase [Buchnera aphidicola (Diuraphis noxia)]